MSHSVDSFVNRSVAARHNDKICAAIYRTTRDLTGVSGTGSGDRIDSNAQAIEELNGSLEGMLAPPEAARVRIINENSLPVGRDSTLIIVNARA